MCGCVNPDGVVMVASARYKELYDCGGNRQFSAPLVETTRAGVYSETVDDVHAQQRQQAHSAPYKRGTYFAERASQWCGEEPTIPTDDFKEIEKLYHRYTDRWGLWPQHKRWERDYCLSKEDTRQLLWEIDRDRQRRSLKPYFVKKYLVRLLFINSRSPSYCAMQRGVCVHGLLYMWHRLRPTLVPMSSHTKWSGSMHRACPQM